MKLTSPGVPDTYQGNELWDLSLVDPDNRRPVDYAARARMLEDIARDDTDATSCSTTGPTAGVKLWLTWQAAGAAASGAPRGSSAPATCRSPSTGAACSRVCAYARSGDGALLLCVVPRLWSGLVTDDTRWPVGAALWGDTALVLPRDGHTWRNVLTGETVQAAALDDGHRMMLGDALATFPVGVFEQA